MCVVSMVMDHYRETWEPRTYQTVTVPFNPQPGISEEEIAEFRRLLQRAREYDARNNEPDCELDEKRQAIKKIAKQLGVEISFL